MPTILLHRFVNYARNVWDRAVTLLPRVDVLWHKYIHMEEMLGNIPGARQVYERWMKWEPDHQPWASYINVRSFTTCCVHAGVLCCCKKLFLCVGCAATMRTGTHTAGHLCCSLVLHTCPHCPTVSTTH